MSQQVINTGSTANDNTGDTLRGSWIKANDNFTELYTLISGLNTATAYTPTFVDSGGGRTFTQTINSARYTQIGNLRWFTVDVTFTGVSGAATGNLRISLPATSTYGCCAEIWSNNLASAAKTEVEALIPAGANYAEVYHYENGNAQSIAAHIQNGSRLVITGVFFSAP
ncbi:MAG: hypothetical protein ACO3IT_08970 [Ilumatobacteraceae bacterium]|jgi:hypothetical protein